MKKLKAIGLSVLKWVVLMLGVVLLAVALRVLVFEVYQIPSNSMEKTLVPGDVIVVNKLIYGAKLPDSPFEIPWVNLLFYMNEKARSRKDSAWWEPRRVKGLSEIKRGDVFVFKPPFDSASYYIKRCVALPGDTLTIRKGLVYLNGEKAGFEPEKWWNKHELIAPVQYATFPYHSHFVWSIDRFGPVVVPKKGMIVSLNDSVYALYKTAIEVQEKVKLTARDGHFYLNDKPVDSYTFRSDYYFMMGDNRHASNDSRYWGFVADYKIEGKATRILWSYRQGNMLWDRLFKHISSIEKRN